MVAEGKKTREEDGAYVSIPRAAQLLGLSERSVGRLIDREKLDCICPSKHRRVSIQSIERLLDAATVGKKQGRPPVMPVDLLA